MIETGTIVEVGESTITVQFNRGSACGKCKVCSFSGDMDKLNLRIESDIKASVGDSVEVEMSGGEIVKSSLIAYIVPLLFAAVGLVMGMVIGGEMLSLIMFALFTVIGFLAIRFFYSAMHSKNSRPRIKKISSKIDAA